MVLKWIHSSFGQYYHTWLYEADVIWRKKVLTLTGMKIEMAKVGLL